MKTHSARWQHVTPSAWVLKAPSKDGGAVLATINHMSECFYVWATDTTGNWNSSRYGAQRAVRKVLREKQP